MAARIGAGVLVAFAASSARAEDAASSAAAPSVAPVAAPAAPTAPVDVSPASEPEPEPAPAPERAAAPEPAPRAAAAPVPPVIGKGFHVYDASYLLLGVGLQGPCQATSTEVEASLAHVVSPGLFWVGLYAAGGFQSLRPASRRPASDLATCFDEDLLEGDATPPDIGYRLARVGDDPVNGKYDPRGARYGAGLEAGWRFVGLDVGYIRNSALVSRWRDERGSHQTRDVHGVRFRAGLALGMELFSGTAVTYGREVPRCCRSTSDTACECKRSPVGVSLFLYYANELYFQRGDVWDDGMIGLTLKIAVGVPD